MAYPNPMPEDLAPAATDRTWSPQQEAIFAWFAATPDERERNNQSPNLEVIARAGSGKTTTILEGINRAPERNILLCAFNKRIAEELTRKLKNPRAEAKTLHALGFAQLRDVWEKARVAKRVEDRADSLTNAAIRVLAPRNTGPTGTPPAVPGPSNLYGQAPTEAGEPPESIKRLISKLHTLGREMAPHASDPADLLPIAEAFDCEPDALILSAPGMAQFGTMYVCAVALKAMEIAASDEELANRTGIDFADMLYLPVRNGWMTPEYDMVVVDEAQDMTVTQLELALGVCATSRLYAPSNPDFPHDSSAPRSDHRGPHASRHMGRVCIVGDDRQAIYGFRGADSGSLARLQEELGADVLHLSTTYRCGQAIVREARELVPDFQAGQNNPMGEVIHATPGDERAALEYLVAAGDPNREDFILSRKNAPLASVAMAYIRANKRVRVQGRDIGAGLKALVERLTRSNKSIPAFLEALSNWEAKECRRAEAKAHALKGKKNEGDGDGPSPAEAAYADALKEAVQDKAETLRVLADSVTGPAELLARIDGLFSDSGRAQVVCSSVHKAKGLEASHVFILSDTLYPKHACRTDEGAAEEANIHYVAITRAIHSLTYVGGIS